MLVNYIAFPLRCLLLSVGLLYYCSSKIYAVDQLVQINGIVLDSETAKPIPFATIVNKNYPVNKTISNSEGVFYISIKPKDCLNVISFGHDDRAFCISASEGVLPDQMFITIFLEPNIHLLENVIVRSLNKDNFKQAFLAKQIRTTKDQVIEVKLDKQQIYQVPAVGISLAINNIVNALPFVKEMRQKAVSQQRSKVFLENGKTLRSKITDK